MKKFLVYFVSLVIAFTCVTNYANADSWVDVEDASLSIYSQSSWTYPDFATATSECSALGGRLATLTEAQSLYPYISSFNEPDNGFWTSTAVDETNQYSYRLTDNISSSRDKTESGGSWNVRFCVKTLVPFAPYEATFDPLTTDVTSLITNFISDAFAPLLALGVILVVLFKSFRKTKKII